MGLALLVADPRKIEPEKEKFEVYGKITKRIFDDLQKTATLTVHWWWTKEHADKKRDPFNVTEMVVPKVATKIPAMVGDDEKTVVPASVRPGYDQYVEERNKFSDAEKPSYDYGIIGLSDTVYQDKQSGAVQTTEQLRQARTVLEDGQKEVTMPEFKVPEKND